MNTMLNTLVAEAIIKRDYSLARTVDEFKDRYEVDDIIYEYVQVKGGLDLK